jgi:hypothetical protein
MHISPYCFLLLIPSGAASVQRQALGGYTSLLAIASSAWKDGASQYLNLVNAKNHHCK